jgi:hypothetical protein
VDVEEVRWKRRHGKSRDYNFFYGKGSENNQLERGFIIHHKIISGVKKVEFVSDTISYIDLRGRWFLSLF